MPNHTTTTAASSALSPGLENGSDHGQQVNLQVANTGEPTQSFLVAQNDGVLRIAPNLNYEEAQQAIHNFIVNMHV